MLSFHYANTMVPNFVLRFLINTYEGLSLQKRFKTGSCNSPKYEVLDIYIFEEI